MKQYMVIETFLPGCKQKIYERFHAQGRMLPEGLTYLNSWLEQDGDRCFQLMETADPALFNVWTYRWEDLVCFEVIRIGDKPNGSVAALDFVRHARAWLAAWNAHDLERILAHYAEDVELISPFVTKLAGDLGDVLRGKRALRDYFARGLRAYPGLRFDFIRLYPGVRSYILEYRSVNDLRAAEQMEFDEQGKVRRVLAHYSEDTGENRRMIVSRKRRSGVS